MYARVLYPSLTTWILTSCSFIVFLLWRSVPFESYALHAQICLFLCQSLSSHRLPAIIAITFSKTYSPTILPSAREVIRPRRAQGTNHRGIHTYKELGDMKKKETRTVTLYTRRAMDRTNTNIPADPPRTAMVGITTAKPDPATSS